MYYVLFRWKKTRERDYMGFQAEKEIIIFLSKHLGDIVVDKIVNVLAELKFGLSAIDPREMEFVDTSEERKEGKEAPDYLPEEIPGPDGADNIPEEEQEMSDEEIIRKNKEALRSSEDMLERGDKAIAAAAEEMKSSSARTRNWPLCPTCRTNKVAPWSKHKTCSKCRKPKGMRKYDMTKRKAKID